MTTCNLFVSGRVVWAGPEKITKNSRPMKIVLVAIDDRDEGALPAIMVTVIGDEANYVDKGSWLSAEGTPDLELGEKDGQTVIRWRMLARRVFLSGADHVAQRRAKSAEKGQTTRSKNAEARLQEAIDFQAPMSGPLDPDAPAFDDEIPF